MTRERRRREKDALHRRIAALNLRGLDDLAIARRLGVNKNTVRVALERPARELSDHTKGPTT